MKFFNSSKYFIGVDEVGRGALAGDVIACACIIVDKDEEFFSNNVFDSKKMSKKKREAILNELKSKCIYSIARASLNEIEELNILHAAMLAMRRAIIELKSQIKINGYMADGVIVDGNRKPIEDCTCFIKGDDRFYEIAASAIIAKEFRDNEMIMLSKNFPEYSFEKNVGYGTRHHLDAIKKHGLSAVHRQGFGKKSFNKDLFEL